MKVDALNGYVIAKTADGKFAVYTAYHWHETRRYTYETDQLQDAQLWAKLH